MKISYSILLRFQIKQQFVCFIISITSNVFFLNIITLLLIIIKKKYLEITLVDTHVHVFHPFYHFKMFQKHQIMCYICESV